jgi:hypothetical protein
MLRFVSLAVGRMSRCGLFLCYGVGVFGTQLKTSNSIARAQKSIKKKKKVAGSIKAKKSHKHRRSSVGRPQAVIGLLGVGPQHRLRYLGNHVEVQRPYSEESILLLLQEGPNSPGIGVGIGIGII